VGAGFSVWRFTLGLVERELLEAYLQDESRFGPAPEGGFTGAAGGAACGDLARISLTVADGPLWPSWSMAHRSLTRP
jgi:hypothetical protein